MSEAGQDFGWLAVIVLTVATRIAWSTAPVLAIAGGCVTAVTVVTLLLAHRRLTRRADQARASARAAHPSARALPRQN